LVRQDAEKLPVVAAISPGVDLADLTMIRPQRLQAPILWSLQRRFPPMPKSAPRSRQL
jgi:hypothetical protein